MELPRVKDVRILELIGQGGCGRVYRVEDGKGGLLALKVFDDAAVSVKLAGEMTERLRAGGWPDGVLPVEAADFTGHPAYRLSPLVADAGSDGTWVPRTLQHRLADHPGNESWKLVKSMASALAGMHRRRVAHGNLKPGNVLLDENGGVLLTDWALGNMPGVRNFHFTDALLYQPPEQLRRPEGYPEEGCGWDVFAFGVMSYRILTGVFPRCHQTFQIVAPPPGVTRCESMRADLSRIADNLMTHAPPSWPDSAGNELEQGYRDWIDRCLTLDPLRRPTTMVEVEMGFEAVAAGVAEREMRGKMLERQHSMGRWIWISWFGFGAAAAVALSFAGLWRLSVTRLATEKSHRQADAMAHARIARNDLDVRAAAEKRAVTAEQQLDYERELGVARLEASRLIGDRLFAWAMEKGHRQLPPLDGRELRLKRLERYFEDFLTRTSSIAELADERARARLQLAEISLAAGDAPSASRRLAEALESWRELPKDGDFKFRVARDSLLLALLRQSLSDAGTEEAFAAARKAFAEVPRADVDQDRMDQLLAILDFHEAKLLAAKGQDTKALEQLMRATQTLNRIAEQRPDAVILRSELAACYLSSATILEGIGSLGDAREVRSLAAARLSALLRENPGDPQLRLDLAGCYGAMAEAALLSGDVTGAETLSQESLKLLDAFLVQQPEHAEALARKAAQIGLRAGIQRDRGMADEAMNGYNEAVRLLTALHASAPDNAMVAYRLALIWWQKGRMLGMGGRRAEEIALIGKARDMLGKLETEAPASGPRPEQLQRSGAYLLGDLGHALQLTDRRDDARRVFSEAVALWEGLARSRPQSEEYGEGLTWCRQRLEDLK